MESPDSIIFVCAGNSCRSPMAKYIMRNLLAQKGLDDKIFVDSAGYKARDGAGMSKDARNMLKKYRVPFDRHSSKKFTAKEYLNFKCIIALDEYVLHEIKKTSGGDPDNKIRLFKDFNGNDFSIDDPFFTRDYERAYKEISDCCSILFNDI